MKRIIEIVLVMVLLSPSLTLAQASPEAARPPAAPLPPGIPKSATIAMVHRVVDGDKLYVRYADDNLDQVLLAGVDAPEPGECFFDESKTWLTALLPKGATIYLESSGSANRAGHVLIRYVWIPGETGKKATLVNTKIEREGYAGFDTTYDSPKYFNRMKEYQLDAHEAGKGLWGACGGVHEAIPTPTAVPTMTPVPIPTEAPKLSAEEQEYLDWASKENDLLLQSVNTVSDLFTDFTPLDLVDQQWIIQLAAVAVTWQMLYDDAITRTPPPAFAELHRLWIQATAHYANAADLFVAGVDNLDADSINAAAAEITLGSESINQATDELERIQNERGI